MDYNLQINVRLNSIHEIQMKPHLELIFFDIYKITNTSRIVKSHSITVRLPHEMDKKSVMMQAIIFLPMLSFLVPLLLMNLRQEIFTLELVESLLDCS